MTQVSKMIICSSKIVNCFSFPSNDCFTTHYHHRPVVCVCVFFLGEREDESALNRMTITRKKEQEEEEEETPFPCASCFTDFEQMT